MVQLKKPMMDLSMHLIDPFSLGNSSQQSDDTQASDYQFYDIFGAWELIIAPSVPCNCKFFPPREFLFILLLFVSAD